MDNCTVERQYWFELDWQQWKWTVMNIYIYIQIYIYFRARAHTHTHRLDESTRLVYLEDKTNRSVKKISQFTNQTTKNESGS